MEIFDGRKSTNIANVIPKGFRIPVFVVTLVMAGYVIYHGRRAWNAAVVEVEAREKNKENEERIESINSATSVRDESRVCNSKKMNYYGGLLLLLAN